MFLRLLQKSSEGLGDVGQAQVHGFGEPSPISLQLTLLEPEVGRQRGREGRVGLSTSGTVVAGVPPRKEICSASIWACCNSWPT